MNQLAIIKLDGKILSVFLNDDILSEVFADNENQPSLLGNIYVAKVKNIVTNIKAAFADIGNGQMCYLSLIEEKVKNGDEIIVQISKDGVKSKQPTITTKLTFTGRYIVLIKGKQGLSLSGKITDKAERERLVSMEKQLQCENYSVILRTNCEGVSEKLILSEFEILKGICENISQTGKFKACFSLLYENLSPYLTYIRDTKAGTLGRIITDNEKIYTEIRKYLEIHAPEEMEILSYYQDDSYSLNHLLGIESKLKKVLNKKVWLNSGASLVIEPTEALTVIDVNTEKAVKGNRNPETTYLKINLEAVNEIARQLRVRNLSGIIIVDFIDMKQKEHRTKLLKELRKELSKDRIKTVVIDMTPLGLVEITRMKKKKPLHEQIV